MRKITLHYRRFGRRYDYLVDKNNATLLCDARTKQARLAALPEGTRPKTSADGYECQAALVPMLIEHYGGQQIGYKIACTNVTAQRQLNVDGPFYGRMMSAFCYDSPARLDSGQFFMRVVEAEFGFRMARALPPRAQPYSPLDVGRAVEGVIPSIEIVDSRFDDWTTVGTPSLIADNACHAVWVKGSLFTDWREVDLAEQKVRLSVRGPGGEEKLVREGSGEAVLGHPLNALAWLATELSSHGLGLEPGQYVTTGVTMEVYMGERGDVIQADFGPLGTVDVVFD